MSAEAILVEGVSKRFRVVTIPKQMTLKEAVVSLRLIRPSEKRERFVNAINDVSFAVARGTTLGVIGRNGSGKTTLMRLLAGIYTPDSGSIRIPGEIAPLLSLGVGFHPDMTGRENVKINGLVLGMNPRQIEARFDEIVEFAGLREFIDIPVRTYSSGMHMRLTFAVAVSVDPDVLLLDEVLAVGDEAFMIVTGGASAGDFLRLLGNGREFGLKHLHYTYQEGEGGIAEALKLCEHFAEEERIVVMLGDNIVQDDITPYVRKFENPNSGARVLLKEVPNPERFGVAELDGDRIVRIEEKPARPKSSFAVTGIYMYDRRVFDLCRTLQPSARGELEITDVNNQYISQGDLYYDVLDGGWSDAGEFESLFRASELVRAASRL